MKQKTFYLHVCFSKAQDGVIYKNDALVVMTNEENMTWLHNLLKDEMEKRDGIKLRETPVIESLTEISKELFEALRQKKEE